MQFVRRYTLKLYSAIKRKLTWIIMIIIIIGTALEWIDKLYGRYKATMAMARDYLDTVYDRVWSSDGPPISSFV